MAICKWRCYWHKGLFIVKTDHKSLCYLQDQTLATELQKKAIASVSLRVEF